MTEKHSFYRDSRLKGALRYHLIRLGKLALGLLALLLLSDVFGLLVGLTGFSSCEGTGIVRVVDESTLVPDESLSINEGAVLRTGVRLRQELEEGLRSLGDEPWQLLGPAPAAVAKVNNRYRYRLTLTAQNTHPLRAMLAQLLRRAQQEKENRGVSVFDDVNPYNG